MTITPDQARAARQLVAWTQDQLAAEVRVSQATVSDFERGRKRPPVLVLSTMQRALEVAGVEFTNDGEPGVKLRKAK
jgi:ribosome-binding protein aMBF1 (putative translation factor)